MVLYFEDLQPRGLAYIITILNASDRKTD